MRSLTLSVGVEALREHAQQVALADHADQLVASITQAAPVSWSTMRCAASASVVSGGHGQDARVHEIGELHGPTLDRAGAAGAPGSGCTRLQQARAVGARCGAVVDRERDGHDRPHRRPGRRADARSTIAPTARMPGSGGLMIALEARDAEHAEVRDGERAALDLGLLAACPARARSARSRASTRELAQRLRLGVADDGHDQAVVERDRDADVRRAVLDELAVDPRAVELRVVAQRERRRRARSGR